MVPHRVDISGVTSTISRYSSPQPLQISLLRRTFVLRIDRNKHARLSGVDAFRQLGQVDRWARYMLANFLQVSMFISDHLYLDWQKYALAPGLYVSRIHAVQLSDNLIGLGNVPAFTHDQIDEPETPRRSLRWFKRRNCVGGATDCCGV